jgi:hypothetical protein
LAAEKLQSQGPSHWYENWQEMLVYSAPKAVTLMNIYKVTVPNGVYGIKLKFKVDWKKYDMI